MQSSILQSCLQVAADDAQQSFTRTIESAIKSLQDAEVKALSSSRRNELTLAWRTLLSHKDALSRRYPDVLRGALDGEAILSSRAADSPNAASFESSGPDSRFDDPESAFGDEDFSLVDDKQLSQAIETSRLLQRITAIVDPALPVLDGLVSSALGLPNIVTGLNPLRPEVFTRTLRTLLTESGADTSVITVWFAFVAQPFGDEVRTLYGKLTQQLKQANVQPVKYKVGQTPDSPAAAAAAAAAAGDGTGTPGQNGMGGTGGPGGQGGPGGPGTGGPGGGPQIPGMPDLSGFPGMNSTQSIQIVDLTDEQVSGEIFRQFFSSPAPAPGTGPVRMLAPAFYQAVDQELAALNDAQDTEVLPETGEEYRDMPAVDRPVRYVDGTMSLNSPMWGEYSRAKERALVRTRLKKEAKDVEQVMGLEMVRQLVNQVAQDARLLGPMREAIVALEPALLRLAMIDPRFFTDASHAGRRLIERVAQRSFRYNDEFADAFNEFYVPVGTMFNRLNKLDAVPDSSPFAEALDKLEAKWLDEDTAEATARNAVVAEMRFAEERQALADQLAYDISQRTDLDLVPASILDFLYGRWTLVMAHARLKDTRGQLDPGGFGSLISDLLWSTKHDLTLNQPVKLIQLIPPMLRKINEGLEMLGQDASEKQSIFDTLERLHKPVLDLCRTRNRQEWPDKAGFRDTLPAAPEAPATAEERIAKPAAQPWFGKKGMQAVGFEEPLATNSEMSESTFGNSQLDSGMDSALGPVTGFGPMPTDDPVHSQAEIDAAAQQSAEAALKAAEDKRTAEEAAKLTPAQIIKALRLGGWVDLYSQETWLRAQLIWASTRRTLFMFESHGGRPHSMTRRSCERLIRSRYLRPVDMREVVARALEAIAEENNVPPPVSTTSSDVGSAAPSKVADTGTEVAKEYAAVSDDELKLSN